MEWIVLLLIAATAAAYIALPRPATGDVPDDAGASLRAQRAGLLELLRELDEDAASGRISPEDRAEGRRTLAPRLREVTRALDALGEPRDTPSELPAGDAEAEAAAPGARSR